MNTRLRNDAEQIYRAAIKAVLPGPAVSECLKQFRIPSGKLIVIAVGKAAFPMAEAASSLLGSRVDAGLILTKYGHAAGDLPGFEIIEAGHPLVDENSFRGAARAVALAEGLSASDGVLFLLSGGGSSLFELSDLSVEELRKINHALIGCGANIGEINTIRKRLSKVKGGRFAALASPAHVTGILLSDVLFDRIDMIASGPVSADPTTSAEALQLAKKYRIPLGGRAKKMLENETPKQLENVTCHVCGSVRDLCDAAADMCRRLGYETTLLTNTLDCEAREAGRFLSSVARTHAFSGKRQAFIAGGETVVHLTGNGLGGRNQELALAAAEGIDGLDHVAVFSVGSDGTDGPTDAAGGYADGFTKRCFTGKGLRADDFLADNDAYHGLLACDGLIKTGPTGTNVNDVSVVLIER